MGAVPKGDPTPGELAMFGARRVAARRALVGYFGRLVRFGLGAAGLVAVRGDADALRRARDGPWGPGTAGRVAPRGGGRGLAGGRHGGVAGGVGRVEWRQ